MSGGKMNDFLRMILNRLSDAIPLAMIAIALCLVGVAVSYAIFRMKYKGTRKYPFAKVILWLVLAGYVAVVVAVTMLRGDGYNGTNFHLFRAWREAWNNFSFKNWANVLLNVAMFVPLGVLLPWIHRLFRKWYVMLGSGFVFSFVIEVFQYATSRGLFDIDDLFANTLGAIFGYGIFMAIYTAVTKGEKKVARISYYAAIPLAITLAISSIFITYSVQDYGNLHNAAIYKISTKGVEWNVECELSNEKPTVSIYKAMTYDTKSCDKFGKAFLEGRAKGELDICYYDQETYYLDHRENSLFVSHLDRSYEYEYHPNRDERIPAELDRETIEQLLSEYDITIPKSAVFTYEGDGWHKFVVTMDKNKENTVGGELRCRYSSEGFIYIIHNNLVTYEYCAEEEILSESEALEQIKRGNFLGGVFEMNNPRNVTILSCKLEYQVDTKGFYQPVYMFKVMYDGIEDQLRIMIPAIK